MTPAELVAFRVEVAARQAAFESEIGSLSAAPSDAASSDHSADMLAEGIFLRMFISYEMDIERMFLHYVTGGVSASGRRATSYLRIDDEGHARKLVRAGFKFLSWAKLSSTKETASNYLKDGWPIVDILATKSQELSDCEKIRNRIAHQTPEAKNEFKAVQRNLLSTERVFSITPGQLLRIRHRVKRDLHLGVYAELLHSLLDALIDPPA